MKLRSEDFRFQSVGVSLFFEKIKLSLMLLVFYGVILGFPLLFVYRKGDAKETDFLQMQDNYVYKASFFSIVETQIP